ncbi:MAG: ATP-binding protein [Gammaproteobacteria bacterium]|nr:ATP-binding protein [Gammaproteobacteria bacterium]
MNESLQQVSNDQQHEIRAEQIRLLYTAMPVALMVSFINASLLAVVQWDVIDHVILLIWFFAVIFIIILRGLLYVTYKKYQIDFVDSERYWRFFLAGVLASALGWGATGIWLFSDDIVHQAFLAFVLAGMSAGAVSSLSFLRGPIISFLVITLLPLIIQLLQSDVFIVNTMGGMLILFVLGLIATSKNIYSNTLDNIVLRMESAKKNKILNQAYQDLELSKYESEKANRAKSEFLSRMSHELRTPMNAIIGFSQLMLMDTIQPLSEEQKDNVNEISVAGEHLLYLINEVLDLSAIESGRLQISMGSVELKDVIGPCLKLIGTAATQKEIKILDQVSEHNYVVQADFLRLKQVMLNILSNAVKYNCDQGIVSVSCEKKDSETLRIAVTDTGRGLADEDMDKLFVAFERLQKNEDIDGTGIGLVITKQLVELMNGRIGVDSAAGKGSTFWLDLALAK